MAAASTRWFSQAAQTDSMFSIEGGDAGVGFDSRYLIQEKITINILSNITNGENEIRVVVLDFLSSLS